MTRELWDQTIRFIESLFSIFKANNYALRDLIVFNAREAQPTKLYFEI